MSGEVGRCGAELGPTWGAAIYCSLRAGHDGWHEDGPTSWSPAVATRVTARPAAGDTRTDRERVRVEDAVHRAIQEASWAQGVAMLDSDVAAFRRAVLALPEVAALLDAAETVARVREVRANVQRGIDGGSQFLKATQVAEHLDRALDGTDG